MTRKACAELTRSRAAGAAGTVTALRDLYPSTQPHAQESLPVGISLMNLKHTTLKLTTKSAISYRIRELELRTTQVNFKKVSFL